jgi:hypothetical protein
MAVIVPKTVLAIRSSTPTRCEAVRAMRVCSVGAASILENSVGARDSRNIVLSG